MITEIFCFLYYKKDQIMIRIEEKYNFNSVDRKINDATYNKD